MLYIPGWPGGGILIPGGGGWSILGMPGGGPLCRGPILGGGWFKFTGGGGPRGPGPGGGPRWPGGGPWGPGPGGAPKVEILMFYMLLFNMLL